jgi:hypothetical protein
MPIPRRTFFVLGGAAVLAACSRNGSTTPASGADPTEPFTLVQRWPSTSLTPGRVRLPLSIADRSQLLTDGPEELAGRIVDAASGDEVAQVRARRHGKGLDVPYWPFEAELETGLYVLTVDGGSPDGAALQVRDAASYPVPRVGQPLPPFDTPTIDDPRGLDPICTAAGGACALHNVTLTEALAVGRPVAYLIGTPAFCQTGTCAPGLDALLDAHAEYGDAVTMVHAEVYTDTTATDVAPAVRAYSMDYEPALFVTDASGIIVARLDAVFDADEIDAALALAGVS